VVTETNLALASHVNLPGQQAIFLGIDDRVRMNRYQDLISLAVDPDAVVEVFVFVVWSELYVNVLANAWWNHSLLVILYFEIWGAWRKNV
jgi:hypothetical protein